MRILSVNYRLWTIIQKLHISLPESSRVCLFCAVPWKLTKNEYSFFVEPAKTENVVLDRDKLTVPSVNLQSTCSRTIY
jgi:hypothetical protein